MIIFIPYYFKKPPEKKPDLKWRILDHIRRAPFDYNDAPIKDEENNLLFSSDGIEDRIILKDLLYKFEDHLRSKRGCGFSLKDRLKGYHKRPITWEVKKQFKEFLENQDHLLSK